jgi:hypothetical protein
MTRRKFLFDFGIADAQPIVASRGAHLCVLQKQ